MPDLHFAKPCTFTDGKGETRVFAAGRHTDVPDEIAGHWFVQAHLMADSATASVPASAPLQHEERTQVKAALDASEQRARGIEAEREAAERRAEALQQELDAAKARIVELEADLDAATRPGEGDGEDADDAAEFAAASYIVKRGHQGRYSVVGRADGAVVASGLLKADAEAKARALNGQG